LESNFRRVWNTTRYNCPGLQALYKLPCSGSMMRKRPQDDSNGRAAGNSGSSPVSILRQAGFIGSRFRRGVMILIYCQHIAIKQIHLFNDFDLCERLSIIYCYLRRMRLRSTFHPAMRKGDQKKNEMCRLLSPPTSQ